MVGLLRPRKLRISTAKFSIHGTMSPVHTFNVNATVVGSSHLGDWRRPPFLSRTVAYLTSDVDKHPIRSSCSLVSGIAMIGGNGFPATAVYLEKENDEHWNQEKSDPSSIKELAGTHDNEGYTRR